MAIATFHTLWDNMKANSNEEIVMTDENLVDMERTSNKCNKDIERTNKESGLVIYPRVTI